MVAETVFYITGSIFFTLSIAMLAIFIVYTLKILQKIVAIESEVKDAVTEVKIKIAMFSVGITSAIALLEKFIDFKNKRSEKKDEEAPVEDSGDDAKEEAPVKKIKIRKIFGTKD